MWRMTRIAAALVFLALADFPTVDHYVVFVSEAIDANEAEWKWFKSHSPSLLHERRRLPRRSGGVFSVHGAGTDYARSEENTSELQAPDHLVCRLLLAKKKA